MLIALIGAPGAGKDTIAKRLVEQHGFVRFAFADKVRELAYATLSDSEQLDIDNLGWDVAKRRSDFYRAHLERVGDGARKVFGEDFWIEQIREQVKDVLKNGEDVVITDLRKENEAAFVGGFDLHIFGGSCIWHVHRPGCERRPFDEWREEWAAFSIPNFGEIEDLHRHVDELIGLCR
jgi:dephospho-CoA kinase